LALSQKRRVTQKFEGVDNVQRFRAAIIMVLVNIIQADARCSLVGQWDCVRFEKTSEAVPQVGLEPPNPQLSAFVGNLYENQG